MWLFGASLSPYQLRLHSKYNFIFSNNWYNFTNEKTRKTARHSTSFTEHSLGVTILILYPKSVIFFKRVSNLGMKIMQLYRIYLHFFSYISYFLTHRLCTPVSSCIVSFLSIISARISNTKFDHRAYKLLDLVACLLDVCSNKSPSAKFFCRWTTNECIIIFKYIVHRDNALNLYNTTALSLIKYDTCHSIHVFSKHFLPNIWRLRENFLCGYYPHLHRSNFSFKLLILKINS